MVAKGRRKQKRWKVSIALRTRFQQWPTLKISSNLWWSMRMTCRPQNTLPTIHAQIKLIILLYILKCVKMTVSITERWQHLCKRFETYMWLYCLRKACVRYLRQLTLYLYRINKCTVLKMSSFMLVKRHLREVLLRNFFWTKVVTTDPYRQQLLSLNQGLQEKRPR